MLSAEKNKMLTQVGPGTPMGEFLRRYWQPIAGASEFDTIAIKPMRLLGEDLVLYKDLGGRFGLIDRQCPHRRADLLLRHGRGNRHPLHLSRLADGRGRPLHRAAVRRHRQSGQLSRQGVARSRPIRCANCAGLLWTYMGPQPAPELPVWEAFTWPNGFREIVTADSPVQLVPVPGELRAIRCISNGCTTTGALRLRGERRPVRRTPPQAEIRRVRSRLHLQPRARRRRREHIQLDRRAGRALADRLLSRRPFRMARAGRRREYAVSMSWFFVRVPKGREPYVQKRVPTW